jgi:hypothetical protein
MTDDDDAIDLGLSAEATRILDALMWFIGNNTINGKEKVRAVQRLRELIEHDSTISPTTVESFARGAGKNVKTARRLGEIHDGLLQGKTFLDYARRPI